MVFELRLKSQIPQLSRTTRKGFHQLSDWIAATEPKDDRVFRYRKAFHSSSSIWTFCSMSSTADIRTIATVLLRKMYAHWNAPLVSLNRINPTFFYLVTLYTKFALEQATKAQRGSRGIAQLSSNLVLGVGWVVKATLRPLYPREGHGTNCTGSWVDPRVGPDECGKSRPTGIWSRTVKSVAGRYIEWAIPDTPPPFLNTHTCVPCAPSTRFEGAQETCRKPIPSRSKNSDGN